MPKLSAAEHSPPALHKAHKKLPQHYSEDEDEDSDDDEYSTGRLSHDTLLLLAQTEYISRRYTKAIALLKDAISKGSARAAYNIGCIYQMSTHNEVPKDYGLASRFYIRALELAMLEVGDGGSGCGSDLLDATIRLTELFRLCLLSPTVHPDEWRASQDAMYTVEKHLRHRVPIPPSDAPLTESEDHRRAVVTTLLFCRGLTTQDAGNHDKAARCYRKCIDMPPSTLADAADLQERARNNLELLASQLSSSHIASLLAADLPLSSFSGSSTFSLGDPPCACCGNNKPQMPICSRCHIARYCDTTCQRSDFEAHASVCAELMGSRQKRSLTM